MSKHLNLREAISRWPLMLVVLAYASSALVIPIGTIAAPSDEWVYARAIERLVTDGVLRVPGPSVANLVAHTAWGGMWAEVLGLSFAFFEARSALLVLLSGLAFYRSCRVLGATQRIVAVAVGTYLFNPLAVGLAWSMMTDATFTALLVLAIWAYLEAVHRGFSRRGCCWDLCFPVPRSLARQPGILIPVAFMAWVLTFRSFRVPSVVGSNAIVALGPAIVTVTGFSWWLGSVNGVPWAQSMTVGLLSGASGERPACPCWWGSDCGCRVVRSVRATTRRRWDPRSIRPGRALIAAQPDGFSLAATGALGLGMVLFAVRRHLMPYAGSWLNVSGIGPTDVPGRTRGGHRRLGSEQLTARSAFCALCLSLLHIRIRRTRTSRLLLLIFGSQLFAVISASVTFSSVPSLDRYMFPPMPPLLLLTASAIPILFINLAPGSLRGGSRVCDCGGCMTETGSPFRARCGKRRTRQSLVASLSSSIDGGAGWSGYHLYEYSRENGLHNPNPDAPGWIQLYDLATDRCVIVATTPYSGTEVLPRYFGTEVMAKTPYNQWLGRDGHVYLLGRCDPAGNTVAPT